ncbi:putative reverse transcriptase domain-containing protein [Tanacetum coccineum]
MANVIPPDHVDDLPIVKLNQPDVVPVIPEPVLVDEDEDPEEEEFEEEEEPQEEKDMDVDDEEDRNEPKLTFPYEEADPLNPPSPTSDSEPEDVIEVEDTVKPEDETIPASVHEVGESSTASFHREDSDGLLLGLMRKDINSLFVRSSVEEGTAAMENLVRKLGNAEERAECKKLKKELEDARGFMFEERPNKAIDVSIEDEDNPSSEPRGSLQSCLQTVQRKIKESVDAAIATERATQANAENNASGSGQARGQVTAPVVQECTFSRFMKCNPDNFRSTEGAVKLRRWFEKTEMTFGISGVQLQRMENELWNLKVKEYNMVAYTQRFNELALMCPRMVEPESAKIDAYIRALSDNIKGEVTSSKPTNLNEAMRMAHKLCRNKVLAKNEKDLEERSKNYQKQGNARAMTTALNEGKVSSRSLPVCERCFTCHVGHCYDRVPNVWERIGHKARYCKEKNVSTGANAQPIWTCYDCGEQGSDRSFVDTRFSSMLDIDSVKINTSYKVELADGRIVSTNIVLKGCTLNLVNHLFEIDLMPIELGTFDVIIGMDWLVKHDAVIICGEKVVHIPCGNKTLIVESDKGMSRLKVISCIKARKYIERGCHLFLAHVTEKKLKEKRLEYVPVIRDFPEVFPDDLPGLPPSRQVEF